MAEQWQQFVREMIERYGNANAVAVAMGVNRSQVSRWRRGGQAPRIDTLQRIAKACPEAATFVRGMF